MNRPARVLLFVFGLAAMGCRRAQEDPRYQVPGLEVMLADNDPDNRATAAQVLGNYGREAKNSVPLLADALKDESAAVRISVTYGLAQIGPDATAAEGALVESLLQDTDAKVRTGAAYALGTIKPESATALEALRKATGRDPDQVVRAEATKSLQVIQRAMARRRKLEGRLSGTP